MPGHDETDNNQRNREAQEALNTVEKETKSCTMRSVGMAAPVASLMPLIIPGGQQADEYTRCNRDENPYEKG